MKHQLREYERNSIVSMLKLANGQAPSSKKEARVLPATLRERLRRWLRLITESEKGRKTVAREVNEILRDVPLYMVLREKQGARHVEFVEAIPRSWRRRDETLFALAIATILNDQIGLANRLKQCGNPNCSKFNLDLKPKGRPRKHCNSNCKAAADATTGADRTARSRKKIAKEKSKRSK